MEAKELRVGNIVHNDYVNDTVEVSGVFSESDECWYNYKEMSYRGPIQALNPIPITTEWLGKMGLTKNYPESGCVREAFHNHSATFERREDRLFLCVQGEAYMKEIHFVHEAQNLYYALIGQELTLSLLQPQL